MEIQKVKLQMVKEMSALYTQEKITRPTDIVKLINSYEEYNLSPMEKIIVIGLNTKNQVNIYTEIATGAVGCAYFKISDILKPLLLSNSSKFILVHNHPSGDATPSKEDKEVTAKAKTCAVLMGLTLLDHIVIGDNSYVSILNDIKEVK